MHRLLLVLASVVLCGCGGSEKRAALDRAQANKACSEAEAAFEKRDYQAALDGFTAAIESGWLHPDRLSSAHLRRAVSRAAVGDPAAALAELDELAKFGEDPSAVLAARAFVLKKQGKAAEANAAFQQARRLNPAVRPFE
jgi:tetratricopeptide (TPR) repeat protein